MRVNHTEVLIKIGPLPGGVSSGQKQIARMGTILAIASLTRTIREDTYDGVTVRIVSLTAGELDRNDFRFAEHRSLPGSSDSTIDRYNADEATVEAETLRGSIELYLSAFC